jgi:hypothetical protein
MFEPPHGENQDVPQTQSSEFGDQSLHVTFVATRRRAPRFEQARVGSPRGPIDIAALAADGYARRAEWIGERDDALAVGCIALGVVALELFRKFREVQFIFPC